MYYKLKKTNNKMVVKEVDSPIIDSYQSINLKPYYISRYFKLGYTVSRLSNPTAYNDLNSLIAEVNTFKEREMVPNKPFRADIPGKSKLQRNLDTGVITLCYRAGVDKARSPNTCFITDNSFSTKSSWVCMNSFYRKKGYNGGNVYYIDSSHPDYRFWSEYMDSEYTRLTGIKIDRVKPRPEIVDSLSRTEYLNRCLLAYSNTGRVDDKLIFKALAEKGLCRLNSKETSLYDKEGYWVCRFEEYQDETDTEGEMITKVLSRLTFEDLWEAFRVIDSFVGESDFLGRSLFEICQ